jgi:hypothetical protein
LVFLAAAMVLLAGAPLLARADKSALDEIRGEATIDWSAGTVTASGGAAADFRMPSPEAARPGALRRARAQALAKLKTALPELPLGGDRQLSAAAVGRALAKARTAAIEYQSNGGAVVKLSVHFGDWIDTAPAASKSPDAAPLAKTDSAVPADGAPVLSVSAMRLTGSPLIKVGRKEVAAGAARYRLGTPPATARAVRAKLERGGKLSIDSEANGELAERLAAAVVLIYVQKVLR